MLIRKRFFSRIFFMRNINRMNDYFVRYLLGSVGNEDILENIVNCVLRDSGFEEVYNLSDTGRGTGGFGSTGAN